MGIIYTFGRLLFGHNVIDECCSSSGKEIMRSGIKIVVQNEEERMDLRDI